MVQWDVLAPWFHNLLVCRSIEAKNHLCHASLSLFSSHSHFQPFLRFFFVLRTLAHVGSLARVRKFTFLWIALLCYQRELNWLRSFVVWQPATSFSNSSTTTIGFVLRKLLTRRVEEISLNFSWFRYTYVLDFQQMSTEWLKVGELRTHSPYDTSKRSCETHFIWNLSSATHFCFLHSLSQTLSEEIKVQINCSNSLIYVDNAT